MRTVESATPTSPAIARQERPWGRSAAILAASTPLRRGWPTCVRERLLARKGQLLPKNPTAEAVSYTLGQGVS